jgi:hypothetical protein
MLLQATVRKRLRATAGAARLAFWLLPLSCHSAGPYGHSKIYSPTSDEVRATQGSQEYDPLLAERAADKLKGRPAWLFGIVTNRRSGPGGATNVALSLRTLQEKNQCGSADEDSCRVTVSDREMGRVHVLLSLGAEDDLGEKSVGLGSLLRVVGTSTEDIDPTDGTPTLRGTFYRHWPRGFYLTAKAASTNKR